jgi:putative endonuclease
LPVHLEIGRLGESMAVAWLEARGFTILERNWKFGRKEIDILAADRQVLHVIEVKTRRSHQFGLPEEQVNRRKIRFLQTAAAAYLEMHPQWRRLQFDILAITLDKNGPNLVLLEDIS